MNSDMDTNVSSVPDVEPTLDVMRYDAECVKNARCGWLAVGPRLADYVLALVPEVKQLRAENARLRDELALWKPMTPEEADAALAEIEPIPISDEEIQRIVEYATDPANRPPQTHYTKLTAKVKQLTAQRDRYREMLGNVVKWVCKYWSPALTQMRVLREATGLDEQAARDLCKEFQVDAETGEQT